MYPKYTFVMSQRFGSKNSFYKIISKEKSKKHLIYSIMAYIN